MVKCCCPQLLIVDDNSFNVLVIKGFLKGNASICDEAVNGKEAIDKVIKKTKSDCCKGYKVILMDLNMPIMDGITATKKIRSKVSKSKVPSTPIVALTAAALSPEEEHELQHDIGFDICQMKPITKDNFLRILNKYSIPY